VDDKVTTVGHSDRPAYIRVWASISRSQLQTHDAGVVVQVWIELNLDQKANVEETDPTARRKRTAFNVTSGI